MHAKRDIVLPKLPPVCLMPVLCLNEWAKIGNIIKLFLRYGKGIILVY